MWNGIPYAYHVAHHSYADKNTGSVAPLVRFSTERPSESGSAGSGEPSGSQEPPSSTNSENSTQQVLYRKVSETFRNATATAGVALQKVREAKLVDSVRHGYAFLKEEMSNTSPRRKPKPSSAEPAADAPPENTTVNAIVPVVKKTTGWEKRWETLKEKV